MRLLARLTALVLLALWLPATGHCALEAAGVISKSCHDGGPVAEQSCADDGCVSLESAHYRATMRLVGVPPPTLLACWSVLAAGVIAVPSTVVAVAAPDRPTDWVPAWHFVRRAAPPSRAPDFCV